MIKGIVTYILLLTLIVFTFSACGEDTNDGKCDVCGKSKYTKLSDGNEYCYDHWKSAIDYYLGD